MSYFPLWIIVCFECLVSIVNNNQPLHTEKLALLLVIPLVICSGLFFNCVLSRSIREIGLQYDVIELKPRKTISSDYVLSYVIPLIAFDFTHWQDMFKFIVLWGFLFILCWRFWQMPIAWLSMLGYSVSDCELQTNDGHRVQKMVISKKPLYQMVGDKIALVDIDNNQAIQTEGNIM